MDGRIGPAAEATVSIMDDGLIRGDGAFEMLKLYEGRPFALADHLDRLDRSADGIFLDWDRATFEREIEALLEANRQPTASCAVLTRGGRRIAIVEPPPPSSTASRCRASVPAHVVLTRLKTLSYGGEHAATRLAKRDGADEALLVEPDGTVLEAPPRRSSGWTPRATSTPRSSRRECSPRSRASASCGSCP